MQFFSPHSGVGFGRLVNAHDRYIVSRVTRRSVLLVADISTVLNNSVFQGATCLTNILRLTKCASEEINHILSLKDEMLVCDVHFTCRETSESGALYSVGEWITLLGAQLVMFMVARPTRTTCKRASRMWTIGW